VEIKSELIDELLKDYQKPEDIIGENGLLRRFVKAVLGRALNAELTHHLGYEKHDPAGNNSGNSRNGTSGKTIKGDFGELEIEVPRDRVSTFEPQILPKHQTRFAGFDDKIISMYARGMTTREIEGHLKEIYGVEVSAGLISQVTEAVSEEVKTWQSRALEPIYGDRVPGCPVRENAARGPGGEPRRVGGHGSGPGGAQRGVGAVDQQQRRRPVLAVGTYGNEEPWCQGHVDRVRGWAERVSASH